MCFHDKNDGNPHAHIMLTMRPLNQDGTWAAKSKKEYILDKSGERIRLPSGEYKSRKINAVDWNDRDKAEEWRKAWADVQNKHLAKHGIDARVDHRSYERQGIDKIPTIHLGAAASQMEKHGIRTERGDINRDIEVINREISQTKARLKKVKTWLYAQPIQNAPTFIDVMQKIADAKNLNTHWQRIANIKTQAKVLMFLQSNKIADMEQFVNKVTQMNEDLQVVSDEIKKVDRRSETLSQHLVQVEIRRQRKAIYDKYHKLTGKKSDAFYDEHFEEIQDYDAANKYIKSVLNGRTAVPINEWKKEQEKLAAHRYSLCEKYYRLKDEVRTTELIKKGAEKIIHEDVRDAQRTRSRDVEVG